MNVELGDVIRFSTELLADMHAEPNHLTVLVKLVEVRREVDGSKTLILQKCSEQLPCECGCGVLVEGGLLERAHPDDYREERG